MQSSYSTLESSKLKKTKKKVLGLESELKQAKLTITTVDQLKLDLAIAMDALDASYAVAIKAQNEAVAALT